MIEIQTKWEEKIIAILYRRIIKELKKYTCGKTCDVIDVGCGRGIFLDIIKKEGWKGIGVDLEKDYARNDKLIILPGDAEALPLQTNAFDIFVSKSMASYVDSEKLLNEALRVTKKGGIICVMDLRRRGRFMRLILHGLNIILGRSISKERMRILNEYMDNNCIPEDFKKVVKKQGIKDINMQNVLCFYYFVIFRNNL